MYQFYIDGITKKIYPNGIKRLSDNAFIPFAPANTDYARFKQEIEAGTAELQDADGQPMSAADAKAYVATLP